MTVGNWVFMAVEAALIPTIMIFFGRSFMKKPPKDMNFWFGYRSKRAQESWETWEFAHRYIGKLWFWMGIVTALITIAAVLFAYNKGEQTLMIVVGSAVLFHLIPLVLSMVLTEHALKKRFG